MVGLAAVWNMEPRDGGDRNPLEGATYARLFLIYSGADVGTAFSVKAVTADGGPHALRDLVLTRGARRVAFLGGEDTLIVLKGDISHKEFWALDLATGGERQLTSFGRGSSIGDFDISADGREIIFDRTRDESDIVLIDLPER